MWLENRHLRYGTMNEINHYQKDPHFCGSIASWKVSVKLTQIDALKQVDWDAHDDDEECSCRRSMMATTK